MNNQHKSNVHFRVPENYFQEFSDCLHSHIQLEKRLGQTSDGFKVPGGYFKETSENLLRHVHSKPKVFNLNKFVYYAAAVMLIGLMITGIYQQTNPSTTQFSSSEIESLMEDGVIPMNAQLLSELFTAEDFENISMNLTSIDNTILEEYLKENYIDYDSDYLINE